MLCLLPEHAAYVHLPTSVALTGILPDLSKLLQSTTLLEQLASLDT